MVEEYEFVEVLTELSTEGLETDALEGTFRDSRWVSDEFAAIMIASGFGDRVIAAVDPGGSPQPQDRLQDPAPGTPGSAPSRRDPMARVRSPPRRP